jgi:hypothetical protein
VREPVAEGDFRDFEAAVPEVSKFHGAHGSRLANLG